MLDMCGAYVVYHWQIIRLGVICIVFLFDEE